jgi:hypothetical protein
MKHPLISFKVRKKCQFNRIEKPKTPPKPLPSMLPSLFSETKNISHDRPPISEKSRPPQVPSRMPTSRRIPNNDHCDSRMTAPERHQRLSFDTTSPSVPRISYPTFDTSPSMYERSSLNPPSQPTIYKSYERFASPSHYSMPSPSSVGSFHDRPTAMHYQQSSTPHINFVLERSELIYDSHTFKIGQRICIQYSYQRPIVAKITFMNHHEIGCITNDQTQLWISKSDLELRNVTLNKAFI